MRKIDLTAMAEKGYSLTEVVNSFKEGSDVRYALENRLFRVETEKDFAPNSSDYEVVINNVRLPFAAGDDNYFNCEIEIN